MNKTSYMSPKKARRPHLSQDQMEQDTFEKEKKAWLERFGMAEDHSVADVEEYKREFRLKLVSHPREVTKTLKKKDLGNLKREIEEIAAANQCPELEYGMEYFKNKYVFPFGDIGPIVDKDPNRDSGLLHDGTQSFDQLAASVTNKDAFNKLCRVKYQLPLRVAQRNDDWIPELQKPISVTIPDIRKELGVFISKFPRDKIPHSNENEHHLNTMQKKLFSTILQGGTPEMRMDDVDMVGALEVSPIQKRKGGGMTPLKELSD